MTVFLLLRGSVRWRPLCAFGVLETKWYHSLGDLITFLHTGNGRKSLFLLLLPLEWRQQMQWQPCWKQQVTMSGIPLHQRIATWKKVAQLSHWSLWVTVLGGSRNKDPFAPSHRFNSWVAKQDLSCQIRPVICLIQNLILATVFEAGFLVSSKGSSVKALSWEPNCLG